MAKTIEFRAIECASFADAVDFAEVYGWNAVALRDGGVYAVPDADLDRLERAGLVGATIHRLRSGQIVTVPRDDR